MADSLAYKISLSESWLIAIVFGCFVLESATVAKLLKCGVILRPITVIVGQ